MRRRKGRSVPTNWKMEGEEKKRRKDRPRRGGENEEEMGMA